MDEPADSADERRAIELALEALNARERTEQELRRFLERRGVEPGPIETAIERMRLAGFVDDAGYARRFAADRRGLDQWGRERIARDLGRRGVDGDLIELALADVGPEDELATAIELLDRRFPLPFDGDRDRDKAWRMLVRRGYEPELAYRAVRRHEQGLADAA